MRRSVSRGRAVIARRWRALRSTPDRGYSGMEAAIVLPIVLFVTMLIVQFVMVWHGRHVAAAAAAAAARSAAVYGASARAGQADGASYLEQVAPNLLRDVSVGVDRSPTRVVVTIEGSVPSVIPFANFTINESAQLPVEAFVGSEDR